jgi:hypothetical protein
METLKIRHNQFIAWMIFTIGLISLIVCPYALWHLHHGATNLSDIFTLFKNQTIQQLFSKPELNRQPMIFCLYAWLCLCIPVFFLVSQRIWNTNSYALIASRDGLWIDRFGLIPWEKIYLIFSVECPRTNTRICETTRIIIQLHDTDFLKPHLSWLAKLQLFMFSLVVKNSMSIPPLAADDATVVKQLKKFKAAQRKNMH